MPTCTNGHAWDDCTGPALPAACPVCGAPPVPSSTASTARTVRAPDATADQPTWTAAAPAVPVVEPQQEQVGDYRIVAELGRGGMGVVYQAYQVSLKRDVALKMVLAGARADADQRARFHREAEAAAQLRHPHIVQVYEVGEHEGQPFFSLEFVEGGNLADRIAGKPQPPRAAAELVEVLARAVQHAHARGVVHRDLKPANILLAAPATPGSQTVALPASGYGLRTTDYGLPKVSDFGLAKQLADDSAQTQSGAIVGSPNYMAPEQAAGRTKEVGPAADIYALGAILYELLTGRPPFQGATAWETIEQVRFQDPVPPCRLQPRVPRDLETVCLKCLEKDPAKRYPTAEALADDLRRFLAGEPIRARPVGRVERAWKWARRRPAWAAVIATGVLGAVALLAVSLWFNVKLKAASARTEANFRRALQAVDQMLTEVAEEELANEPRMEKKRRALLERALTFYEEFLAENGAEPEVRYKAGLAYKRVGDILRLLEQPERAEAAYGQAIALLGRLADDYPGVPEYRQNLAASHNWLGELMRTHSRVADARAEYGRAMELQARLAEEYPDEPAYRRDLARSHYNLGILLRDVGQPAEAEASFVEAVGILRALADRHPDVPAYRQELARAYLNLGPVLRAAGRPRAAEQAYDTAIRLLTDLAAAWPAVPDYRHELGVAHDSRGILLAAGGRLAGAGRAHREAVERFDQLMTDFPLRPVYRAELANSLNSQGAALARLQDWDGADRAWARAEAVLVKLVAEFPEVPAYHGRLGMVLGNRGRLYFQRRPGPAARGPLEQAVAHLERALKPNPDNPDYRQALRNANGLLKQLNPQVRSSAP